MNIVYLLGTLICNTPDILHQSDSLESIKSIESDDIVHMYVLSYTNDVITNLTIYDSHYDPIYSEKCVTEYPIYTDMLLDKFFENYKSFFLNCDTEVKRVLFVMGDRRRFQDVILYNKLGKMKCMFDKMIFDEHFLYENGQVTNLGSGSVSSNDYYFVKNTFLI